MALELKTTRGADGSMTAHAPGAPAGGNGNMLAEVIRMRQQQQAQPRAPIAPVQAATAPGGGGSPWVSGRPAAAAPRSYAQEPSYTPQMGQAPIAPREVSRMVRDPYASPMTYGTTFGAGRFAPTTPPNLVKERYIDGKWEFDNVDASRQGGGGAGRIDVGSEPANQYASFSAADDPRMQALVAAQKKARL